MKSVKKVYPWIIIVFLSLYLSFNLTNMMIPQPQFTVDLSQIKNDKVTVYTYHNKGTAFPMSLQSDGSFVTQIDSLYFGKKLQISLNIDRQTETVSSAVIDGKALENNQIIKVTRYADFSVYKHLTILKQMMVTSKSILSFCGIGLLLFFLLTAIYIQTKTNGNFLEKLTYSKSAWSVVGKKSIVLSFIIAILSIIIYCGCDISVILGAINLHQLGIDIYQLQSSSDSRLKVQFVLWPYNETMLIFYSFFTCANRLFLPLFQVHNGPYAQYIVYKLVNMLLIDLTVLSIISFLIDHKIINSTKAKSIYLWSVFNPLTFYIAVLYVQLDIFPVYCLTLGLLLLFSISNNYMLSAFLLAVGISTKLQTLLHLPMILLVTLSIIIVENQSLFYKVKQAFKFILAFTLSFFLLFGMLYLNKGPMYQFLGNIPQAARAWWTVLNYAPGVYLYITIFVLVIAVLLNIFNFNSELKPTGIVMNGLFFYGVVVLLFSFAILSTPSTLLHTLPAFTLLYAMVDDKFQRAVFAACGLMIVFEVLFTSVGDITASLQFFGKPAFFTQLEMNLGATESGIKYSSLLLSISHGAMLAYAMLFYKKAQTSIKLGV